MSLGPPAFHRLRIADVRRETADAISVTFDVPASLRAGLDLPFACKGGMCSTCRAKLTQGTAEMAPNYSLEPWELAAGFMLTCQARPTSPRVALDYDQQ